MKKRLKLLLLGGIFTLIGIFNFSSAYILTGFESMDYNNVPGSDCVNKRCSFNNLVSSSLSEGSCFEIKYYCNDWSNNFKSIYGSINLSDFSSCGSEYLSQGFRITDQYGNSSQCRNKGQYVNLVYGVPKSESAIGYFTPIITGLTNSVNEFIPYVAYIGIGLLTALIGFVAIKRLINWVRAKIFSSFKR